MEAFQSLKAERRSLPSIWLSAVLFVFGMAAAWWGDWRLHDVIWGFWVTSLAVGYLMILGILVHQARHQQRDLGMTPAQAWGGALFLLAFFSFHFGFFHWGHAQFLTAMLDWPEASQFSVHLVPEIFAKYWPIVLAGLLFRLPDLHAYLSRRFETMSRRQDVGKAAGDAMALPYAGVIRLHLAIFGLFGLAMLELPELPMFALAYAWFFLPFDLRAGKAAERRNPQA